jgi:hypothetical protein
VCAEGRVEVTVWYADHRCLSVQGQSNYYWARQAAKWGADFMAKATEESRVILHIGDIKADHAYMGRAEDYPQIDRNILWCDSGGFLLI